MSNSAGRFVKSSFWILSVLVAGGPVGHGGPLAFRALSGASAGLPALSVAEAQRAPALLARARRRGGELRAALELSDAERALR